MTTKRKPTKTKIEVTEKPINQKAPSEKVRNKIMADNLLPLYYAWIEAGRPTRA